MEELSSRLWRRASCAISYIIVIAIAGSSATLPSASAADEVVLLEAWNDFGHAWQFGFESDGLVTCWFHLMVHGGKYDALLQVAPGRDLTYGGLSMTLHDSGPVAVHAATWAGDAGFSTRPAPDVRLTSPGNGLGVGMTFDAARGLTVLAGLENRDPMGSPDEARVTVSCDAPHEIEASAAGRFALVHGDEFRGGTGVSVEKAVAGYSTIASTNTTHRVEVPADHEAAFGYWGWSYGDDRSRMWIGLETSTAYDEVELEGSETLYRHVRGEETLTASFRGWTDDGGIDLWSMLLPDGWNR